MFLCAAATVLVVLFFVVLFFVVVVVVVVVFFCFCLFVFCLERAGGRREVFTLNINNSTWILPRRHSSGLHW